MSKNIHGIFLYIKILLRLKRLNNKYRKSINLNNLKSYEPGQTYA